MGVGIGVAAEKMEGQIVMGLGGCGWAGEVVMGRSEQWGVYGQWQRAREHWWVVGPSM